LQTQLLDFDGTLGSTQGPVKVGRKNLR
jgi:hypothetical protein